MRRRASKYWAVGLSAALMILGGCGDDDSGSNQRAIELALDGLETLEDGFVFEGWLIADGSPVSTGRFADPAVGSTIVQRVDRSVAAAATAFVLTIEPDPDPDPAPAATHVLAGDVVADSADLTVGHPAALGDDFSMAMGSFILETPSTAMVAEDFSQGIWWLDLAAGPGASLALPVLPAGWVYEGWVVNESGPVSTGRFTDPAAADSDLGGPAAGADPTPPFPGQDFIDPALDLIGLTAVVSIEPEPDDSPGPFAFKPLVDPTIDDVGAGMLQAMMNQAETLATGTLTLR